MDLEEARAIRARVKQATLPDKLLDMPLKDLEAHYYDFHSTIDLFYIPAERQEILRELDSLRREVELKRSGIQSAKQHGAAMAQGSTILCWTKAGVWIAIAVGLCTVVPLIVDIPFSKLLPSKSSQRPPLLTRYTVEPLEPSVAPKAKESPSQSPQVSPTPESTSTPTETPIKFPPPAP